MGNGRGSKIDFDYILNYNLVMDKKYKKKLISYWIETSEHDYETMLGLYKMKRYSDALFYGHIVLEKILKAISVGKTKKDAPKTHNLVYLVELSEIKIDSETKKFLATVNRFNMRARYPDVKFNFYKTCTAEYTKENLSKIKKLYKKLCQEFKLKK